MQSVPPLFALTASFPRRHIHEYNFLFAEVFFSEKKERILRLRKQRRRLGVDTKEEFDESLELEDSYLDDTKKNVKTVSKEKATLPTVTFWFSYGYSTLVLSSEHICLESLLGKVRGT